MSDPGWSLEFERRAERDLRRLDPPVKQRVLTAVAHLADDPGAADLRSLSGRSESRLRVGDWRVLLELEPDTRTIVVLRVLPRGRAYDR